MGRCSCAQATCQCVLVDSPTIDFSGAGSAAVPYAGVIKPLGVAPLLISTDAGNTLGLGADGLLKTGVRAPRTLFSTGVPVGNVGPGVDPLATVVIPANTLTVNGDRLRFRAALFLDAALFDFNGFVFSYGGAALFTRPTTQATVSRVYVEGDIIRTGAATERCDISALFEDNGGGVSKIQGNIALPAANNAAANTFLVTGETAGALNDQVVLHTLTIDVWPV